MAVLNAAKRELDIKIVYYGPALCGKTTNVQCIHTRLTPDQRGDIMTLATKDDRTLFFDFLPIELGNVKGFKTRFHMYTVPGQVYYALTRRAVLTSVDGIIFVADSQKDKMEENLESLNDLNENLKYYKKELTTVPFIIQYNKRDLENILPVATLDAELNTMHVPSFEASALKGTGIMETLTACCKLVLKHINSPSDRKQKPQEPVASLYEEGADADEPIIRITREEAPVETVVQEPIHETPHSKEEVEMPSAEPLVLEEPPVLGTEEPEIKMDRPEISLDTPGEEVTLNEPLPVEDTVESASAEPEIKMDRPEIPLDTSGEEITLNESFQVEDTVEPASTEPEITLDEPSLVCGQDEAAGSPEPIQLDDETPSLTLEEGPDKGVEISLESPAIDIQPEAQADVKITSCGQAQKISDTMLSVPVTFQNEEHGKEYTVTITITFDGLKLKG